MPGASRERFRLQTAQPLKTGARSTLGPARPLTPLSICGLFSSPVLLSLTPLAGCVTLCEPGLLRTVFVGEQIPFYMKTVLSLHLQLFKMEVSSPVSGLAAFVYAHIAPSFFSGALFSQLLGKGNANQRFITSSF